MPPYNPGRLGGRSNPPGLNSVLAKHLASALKGTDGEGIDASTLQEKFRSQLTTRFVLEHIVERHMVNVHRFTHRLTFVLHNTERHGFIFPSTPTIFHPKQESHKAAPLVHPTNGIDFLGELLEVTHGHLPSLIVPKKKLQQIIQKVELLDLDRFRTISWIQILVDLEMLGFVIPSFRTN